ncbi:MAG: M24 family metallopeptidase, partial [Candidatus Marinimicrobia bacterium]|nr:M24 family metallopeptidase [Candidatus Neomarinimicrobiota bacterium]
MIYIRSLEEVEKIRESNRIVAETLVLLGKAIKPGISTLALDKLAEEYIHSQDAQPAFKGYNGFPASICASIDEQVVHGIPSQRELCEGEIIGIDVGALKGRYYGDAAFTFAVGQVDETRQQLMRVTEDSLYK